MQFYSQFGQDRHLVTRVYPGKTDGWFVDVGAWNGVVDSNTLALEELGWRGVCVEPHSGAYATLAKRRKCTCYNVPLLDVAGKKVVFFEKDCFSGIQGHLGVHLGTAMTGRRRELVTDTLDNVLKAAGAPFHIDYLSLDTEGSELEILKGANLGERTFGYIALEHNGEMEKRKAIRNFLLSNGYVHVRENVVDDDYALPSIAEKI